MPSLFEHITYATGDGVATITLDRPRHFNAMSMAGMREIIDALDQAGNDRQVRVTVLTATGDVFCAGADIKELPDPVTPLVGYEMVGLYLKAVETMRALSQPVVARVNGPAHGGGCCLALGADLRVASDNASFSLPFVNLGLSGADMAATYLLPRLIGYGRACELLMLGESIDAQEAQRIGLVNRVVPREALDAATQSIVARLRTRPPVGLGFTKRALQGSLDRDWRGQLEHEQLAQTLCLLTEDFAEGRQAFVEKRTANFKGR